MKKYGLLADIRRPRKWIQLGQQVHKYENLLNRDFQANQPNTKWVTDISYIQTSEGTLYLSMIRYLYDNSIVAYDHVGVSVEYAGRSNHHRNIQTKSSRNIF